ncbi:MAG: ImmA/IrrE family metallo-endopeptidase [Dehalococcoidia bacterium]|nr:MAG: ImmA/IrrE family metallo-endopeptidase [Dehalococcoidia bacterium]
MREKVPRWESELWSYMSSSDGMHCPLASHCQIRQSGKWCIDDNMERLNQLLDAKGFNLRNYDFIECEACGRIFKMVEMLARRYLKRGRVRCPPVPTGLVSLFDEQYPVEVRLLPLKVYHGAIWHPKGVWIIQLKAGDTSAAKRFTLFHEAFHILAHCRTTPVFRKRGTIQGSFNELLADYFATCILMPREWVKEKWVDVHDLNKVAKIFGVPQSAMCIRLKRLGLI